MARQENWRREDSLRWHQDLQQTYARFLSALYEWDNKLLGAQRTFRFDATSDTRSEIDMADIDRARRTVYEQLPLLQFMARRQTWDLAVSAADLPRQDLGTYQDYGDVSRLSRQLASCAWSSRWLCDDLRALWVEASDN